MLGEPDQFPETPSIVHSTVLRQQSPLANRFHFAACA